MSPNTAVISVPPAGLYLHTLFYIRVPLLVVDPHLGLSVSPRLFCICVPVYYLRHSTVWFNNTTISKSLTFAATLRAGAPIEQYV